MASNNHGGYNGRASFTFEVDRYQTLNGKLLTEEEAENLSGDKVEYKKVELEVTGRSYYNPAKLDGLPEDCYPEESECEIEEVVDSKGNDWYHKLTLRERNDIEQQIDDYARDKDDYEPDYESNYDYESDEAYYFNIA